MKIDIGTSESGPVTIDPARLVSTRMLIQANSGGGKSWMLRVLCERLGKATPLIVLDWEGEFASLREKLDVLLVGRGGEVPTAVATAGPLATQILEMGVSAVIDLYDLSRQEKRAYVRRFLESLMAAPKRLWRPYFVIVDEAHDLVPEAGQAESADAVNSLMSQGRKRQFCGILATQRLSKLHKDAAAEANNVLIGRCTLDLDQKRAGDTLGMTRAEYTKLREMREGQFHAFGPAFNFDGVQLIKSAMVETTHGAKALKAFKPPEPSVRMQGVVEQLKDLAERAKTEVLDLDSARATIKELRGKLVKAERSATNVPAATTWDQTAIDLAVSAARSEARKAWARIVRDISLSASRIEKNLVAAAEDQATLARTLESASTLLEAEPSATAAPKTFFLNEQHTTVVPKRPAMTRAQATAGGPADTSLPKGERAILTACAMYEGGVDRTELTVLTGYKRSTRDAYVQRLGEKGYVAVGSKVEATPAGIDALGDFEPLPTGDALREWWSGRLPEGERKVLEALAAAWPNTIDRDSVTEATGYKRSTRDAYIQRLGGKRLVVVTGGGVKAADNLFDGGLS
jgi:hypothetical protein